jgi:hypothetical protein
VETTCVIRTAGVSADGVNRTLYPGRSSGFWRSLPGLDEDEYLIEPICRPHPAVGTPLNL